MNDLMAATDTGFELLVEFWDLMTSNIVFSILMILILLPKFFKLFQRIRQ